MIIINMVSSIIFGMILFINLKDLRFSNNMNIIIMWTRIYKFILYSFIMLDNVFLFLLLM